MSTLVGLIKALFPRVPAQELCDEAYLAQAVDNYDLERRMREIDARGNDQRASRAVGIGLR